MNVLDIEAVAKIAHEAKLVALKFRGKGQSQ